jgi:hypothetical protein
MQTSWSGVGARAVRSLAMVAEVVHGAPYRFQDPARFSLAHGGKDRHPYARAAMQKRDRRGSHEPLSGLVKPTQTTPMLAA